jgi:ferrous iron transport protein A
VFFIPNAVRGFFVMSLYQLQKSKQCTIYQIPSIDLLNAIGVRRGISVKVLTRQPFGGPIVIQVGRRSIALARDIAEQILVEEVS